ncbi:MAG: hypothetical protein ABSD67_04255 [Terracidiphilus sp.]
MSAYCYSIASTNFWMRIGVFNARSVRRFSWLKPNVSSLPRRTLLLEAVLLFKAKFTTLIEIVGNYTDMPPDIRSAYRARVRVTR